MEKTYHWERIIQFVGQRKSLCAFDSIPAIPAYDSKKFFLVECDHERTALRLTVGTKDALLIEHEDFLRYGITYPESKLDRAADLFLAALSFSQVLSVSTIGLINIPSKLGQNSEFKLQIRNIATKGGEEEAKFIHITNDDSIDIGLPRMRLRCLTGEFHVAVTVRTFSNDVELVDALRTLTPHVTLNQKSDKLEGENLIEFLRDADGVVVGMERPTHEVLAKLPFLRVISKYGVGVDNIDFKAAQHFQVPVHFKKGLNTNSVVELTLAFAIMLLRRIGNSMAGYREGRWNKTPGRELSEITIGLIGYGTIGRVVANKFLALGVKKLLVHEIAEVELDSQIERRELEEVLAESDLVSLHLSMLPQNYHLVNADFIEKMKPGALLVNTSRGEVIDEAALVAALVSGHLAGAALDVFEGEPIPDRKLIDAPNLLTTCHIGGSSNRAIKNMGYAAIEGIAKELAFA